jgi:NAD(P)H-hydrate epimerase
MSNDPQLNALYSVAQVRELEHAAIKSAGIPGYELMRRAGREAFDLLRVRWPGARRIVVLCGGGNNGGDGYALAQLAHQAGFEVCAIAIGTPRDDSEAAQALADWRAAGGQTHAADFEWPHADVYVDALFGIGLTRPIEGILLDCVEKLNARSEPVLAIDVPSGLNADTGVALGAAVCADATITFVADKRGLHTGAAMDYTGEIHVHLLDLPEKIYADIPCDAGLLNVDMLAAWLPRRARDSHKGRYGHVLAIGGDLGMGGAIRLAGEAALRVGAGLVSVATQVEHITALNAARPELMAHAVAGTQELKALLERASVVAVGPGLGQRAWGHALWYTAVEEGKPLVLDADGLNLLARDPLVLPESTVLTPHPGEAARLLSVGTNEIARDRFAAARQLARKYHAVVVLKGAGTLVAQPGGTVAVCPWGNPGMAAGGMGDLLTGVIAGLLAQGLTPWQAACAGVALHARAGDAAAREGEAGLIASDLFTPLHRLRNDFDSV